MWWGSGADPGEDPPPPPPQQESEEALKDKFLKQQSEITQLKELLKKDEQKLVATGKELEQYATKLSDIKSRSKASKRRAGPQKTDPPESKVQVQDPATPKAEVSTPGRSRDKRSQGNLVLLRKQLEENRAKFEQRGKEMSENKKDIEEMVLNLKTQLDERDITIQELQKGLEAQQSTVAQSFKSVIQEIQPIISSPVDYSNHTQDELHTQLVHRDNKIIELSNKLIELEATVLDLQENFREKDSVIDARTKAIALMSEDFSRRNKITLDSLEETREEMRKMQNNFIMQEGKLKDENDRLKKEAVNKNQRLRQLEENHKNLESVRFDLSTRNAELQEKLVRFQEQNSELQKRVVEFEEKEQDIIKMSDANEEIVRLQNRIAELEEDKGNLQLHLVDFDELKVSESHWQTRVAELEERTLQQSQDLDSHVHMITLLEAEKLDHMQALQTEKQKLSDMEVEVGKLKSSLVELENHKVCLEIKTVDLEEQLDILAKEKSQLQQEILDVAAFQNVEVKQKEASLDSEEMTTNLDSLKQLQDDFENASKKIEEQKEIIMELSSKLESREDELEMQQEIIARLEQFRGEEADQDKLSEIMKEFNEVASDLEEWKRRCFEVEKRLEELDDEKKNLENRFREVRDENSNLSKQLEEHKAFATDLTGKLKEHSNAIAMRDEKISSLQSMIEMNGQTLEAREMTLKDVHEKLNNVEKQFESRHSELKSTLAGKDNVLADMASELEKVNDLIKERDDHILKLGKKLDEQVEEVALYQQLLASRESIVLQAHEELAEVKKAIEEKNHSYSELSKECQQHCEQVEKLNNELLEKNNRIQSLELQVRSNADQVTDSELQQELTSKNAQLEESINKLQSTESKLKELTEKNKKFIANLKAKAVAIKGHEQKLLQYEEVVQAKDLKIVELASEVEKLKQDASNDLKQKFEETDSLTNQLSEEQSKIEILNEELGRANDKIVSLENDYKLSEARLGDLSFLEEAHNALKNKFSELEREMDLIQIELRNKNDKITLLEEEKKRLSEEIKLKANKEEDFNQASEMQAVLEERIRVLEMELAKENSEGKDKLTRMEEMKDELLKQLLELNEYKEKMNQLTQELRNKECLVGELQEELSCSNERHQSLLSAFEAKLQERDVVVESLEQDLYKAMEKIQHLDEGLSNVEERRQSLETKAETLNMRLQESDRVKEEVVENEGLLEQQLQELIVREENLKKKIEDLHASKVKSEEKITELASENSLLRVDLSNMEANVKCLQKELDRLSTVEYSLTCATVKIESLEAEIKRVAAEYEHRIKEKVQGMKEHIETLESDLRNLNSQLEELELEKKTLMERYERLSDEKLNLEDEIENVNETIEAYKITNSDLKREYQEKLNASETTISENEVLRKELEERVQYLETELLQKTLVLEEKLHINNELYKQIETLEEEMKTVLLKLETTSTEKEQLQGTLREKIDFLESDLKEKTTSFECSISEKNEQLNYLQNYIQEHKAELERYQNLHNITTDEESHMTAVHFEEQVNALRTEIEHLKSVLANKDDEIKRYNTRLLQLHFGNVSDAGSTFGHESSDTTKVSELEETLKSKDMLVSDLNKELEELKTEHARYQDRIEELLGEVNHFQEEAMNRNNDIKQLQATLDENPAQMESMRHDYETRLSCLEAEKAALYQELLRTQAEQEVSHIVEVAEKEVERINLSDEKECAVVKTVTFQETAEVIPVEEFPQKVERVVQDELHQINLWKEDVLERIGEIENITPPECDAVVLEDDVIRDVMPQDGDQYLNLNTSSIETAALQQDHQPMVETSWDVVEEGWGWGSDEARLEEEHIQKQQKMLLNSESSNLLNERIASLEVYVKELEMEKERLSEELHVSQVRSGKMLKKLKDMKLKNDNLMKENIEMAKKKSENNFGDLDQAIEEELKLRIDALEKELKELKTDKDSIVTEKESLLKRIDMLTSANERFVEMKERQDIDMEVWRQKNRDLANEVQSLEWKVGELMEQRSSDKDEQEARDTFFSWDKHTFKSETESSNKELEDKIAALCIDNENLQVLLEEQRNLRLVAEASLNEVKQQYGTQSNSELEHMLEENARLKVQLEHLQMSQNEFATNISNNFEQEYARLKEESEGLQKTYIALKEEYNRMCKESEDCVTASEKKYEQLHLEYTKKIDDVCNEKIKIEEQYQKILTDRDTLTEEVRRLTAQLAELNQTHEILKSEYGAVKEMLIIQEKSTNSLEEQKLNLEYEVVELRAQVDNSTDVSNSAELFSVQQVKIISLERELREKTDEIETLRQLTEGLKLEQAKVEQDWNSKLERLRKEMEFNAEDLLKQQDRHSLLMKEHEELKMNINNMVEHQVLDILNTKEKELMDLRSKLKEEVQTKQIFEQILHEKEKSISDLNLRLNESINLINIKESDIENLKLILAENENKMSYMYSVETSQQEELRFLEKENKLIEELGLKNKDIYNLQVLLSEKDAAINELQQTLDEEAKQLTELRDLLEDRELQMRQFRSEVENGMHQTLGQFHSSVLHDPASTSLLEKSIDSDKRSERDSIADDSQQGELDLALYMLHQRDVRCDELTLELMQLLEERDSLQLRLSNALRLNEELRNRSSSPSKTVMPSTSISIEQSPQHVLTAVPLSASVPGAANEPQEDLQVLADKLSQLRSVGYRRDVTLQDEREQRHNQQVRLLHHRGSGIVVDANYTLSRDVQSPSTVLLNWIWGRSTPRVMHV